MIKLKYLAPVFVSGVLLGGAATAQGYLKVPDIPGESRAAQHEGEISIMGVSWGVEAAAASQVGTARARARSTVGPIIVKKQVDASSPYLFQSAAQGKSFREITVTMEKDSGEAHLDYLVITMTNARITSVETYVADGESKEKVSFAYESINMKYTEQDDDHSAGDEHEIEYSVAAGR